MKDLDSEAIDMSYETVSTPPSPAHSTPYPSHQTAVDDSLYEPLYIVELLSLFLCWI